MQDIKIRIWDRVNKTMVTDINPLSDIKIDNNSQTYYKNYPIINSNIEQMLFTGLYDSKGTPIYEKDIVKISEILEDDKYMILSIHDIPENVMLFTNYSEVIGNIYLSDIKMYDDCVFEVYDYIQFEIEKCPFCGKKHALINKIKDLTNTFTIYKIGDNIGEKTSKQIVFNFKCTEKYDIIDAKVQIIDGVIKDIVI